MSTRVGTPLEGQGLLVLLPDGWDGRIYMNGPVNGETPNPVMHIATFPLPLPDGVGDYGNGAIDLMGPADAFVALVEFNQELATETLFQTNTGMPRPIAPDAFDGQRMQVPIPGFGGVQFFFNIPGVATPGQALVLGRAFCLYVVVGDMTQVASTTMKLNPVLETVEIAPSRLVTICDPEHQC